MPVLGNKAVVDVEGIPEGDDYFVVFMDSYTGQVGSEGDSDEARRVKGRQEDVGPFDGRPSCLVGSFCSYSCSELTLTLSGCRSTPSPRSSRSSPVCFSSRSLFVQRVEAHHSPSLLVLASADNTASTTITASLTMTVTGSPHPTRAFETTLEPPAGATAVTGNSFYGITAVKASSALGRSALTLSGLSVGVLGGAVALLL